MRPETPVMATMPGAAPAAAMVAAAGRLLKLLDALLPGTPAAPRAARALERLRTLVNGFETANDLKAYRVEFSYAGARMHLKSFKEIPNAGN